MIPRKTNSIFIPNRDKPPTQKQLKFVEDIEYELKIKNYGKTWGEVSEFIASFKPLFYKSKDIGLTDEQKRVVHKIERELQLEMKQKYFRRNVHNRKISEEIARKVKAMTRIGIRNIDVASKLNIKPSMVSDIKNERTWKYIKIDNDHIVLTFEIKNGEVIHVY